MRLELVQEILRITGEGVNLLTNGPGAGPRLDAKLPTSQGQAIAAGFLAQAEASATMLCPITGLFVASAMPPTGDFYLTAIHPIAFNALAILDSPAYWESLDTAQLAGLILAALAALGKVDISCHSSAFSLNLRIQATTPRAALLDFLRWVNAVLRTGVRHYPKLALAHQTYTAKEFSTYQAWVYSIDRIGDDGEITEAARIYESTPSSSAQLRKLNANAYEEWLEVVSKGFIPASFKDRVKPFIKNLIGLTDAGLIAKVMAKVESLADDDGEPSSMGAALLFGSEIALMRKKADALGIYANQLDEWDSGPAQPDQPSTPTLVPSGMLEVRESRPAPSGKAAFLAAIAKAKALKDNSV